VKNNPVVWFESYVQDMNRAKAFYESMLGVGLVKLESPIPGMDIWAFPMQEKGTGATGALVKMEGFSSGGNGILVYFACADCAVEAKKALSSGGPAYARPGSVRYS